MIKYLGSKRLLVPLLVDVVGALAPTGRVIDLFSGTSRVGHALKARGYAVAANDHNTYAATLARCYVQADAEEHLSQAERILAELSRLPGRPGYVTRTFCEASRFFQPKNGERIDAIRDAIAAMSLDPELEAVLLVSLLEAADRVDSTTGVQMAYLKQWAPRSFNDLELRVPAVLPRAGSGKGSAHARDALEAARALDGDICYLDPPYNQHKYIGNYHIWETLVRWDAPETYGVACKRVDCQDRGSPFNSRLQAKGALAAVISAVRAPHVVVSFNDEGYLTEGDLFEMLRPRGEVVVIRRPFKRYVGARIGIHNPEGKKVGKISHVDNHELVFVASPDAAALDRVRALEEDGEP